MKRNLFRKSPPPFRPLFTIVLLTAFLASCTLFPSSQPAPAQSATQPPTATHPIQPSDTPFPTPTVVQGTVSIWHSWPEDDVPALAQIRAGFSALYPNVLFDITYIPPEDLRRAYEVETLNGNGPALLLGPAEWGPYLYDVGLVSDLSDLVNQELLNSLNKPALANARYKGALIGLPYALEGIVLYRNKDLMTVRANTFEEMTALAQAATQGEVVGAVLERSFLYSGAHLAGLGGTWMDENGLPTFNDAAGLAWLDLLTSFSDVGAVTFLSDSDLQVFKDGKAGWIIDGTWNLQELAQSIGADNLAIDPWPSVGQGSLSGFVFSENLYLSPKVEGIHRTAAQKFIEYFFSAEAQSRLAQVGRIPAATGIRLDASMNGSMIAEAMAALAGGTPYPLHPGAQIYATQMDFALKGYFEEKTPPEQTLQQAYLAILNAINALQLTPTPAP
jgi:arabinogalactan oligomer/maltooligosaccharide transport system substrate-binding protein